MKLKKLKIYQTQHDNAWYRFYITKNDATRICYARHRTSNDFYNSYVFVCNGTVINFKDLKFLTLKLKSLK